MSLHWAVTRNPNLTVEIAAFILGILAAVIGWGIARAQYSHDEPWTARLASRFAFLQPALAHRWYVDDSYYAYIVLPLRRFATWCATLVDQRVIDGTVNGVGQVTMQFGGAVRKLQNGAIPTYALSIFLGAIILIAYFLFNVAQ